MTHWASHKTHVHTAHVCICFVILELYDEFPVWSIYVSVSGERHCYLGPDAIKLIMCLGFYDIPTLKSMLVNKDFQTLHLIGWQHNRQPIRSHDWKALLSNTEFNSLRPSDAYIWVNELTIIGSDNGLSPGRRQAIIWTDDGILLIGPLGEILIEI